MSTTYSMKRDDATLKEMIEYYGIENIPNPEQYPIRFEFLTRSFEHYKKMQTREKLKNEPNT
jgi:hypothetical protein